MKSAGRVHAVAALLALTVGCGREASGPENAARARAAGHDIPMVVGLSPRDPKEALPVVPNVVLTEAPRSVRRGTRAEVIFTTRPRSSCELRVTYADGSIQRLRPVVADGRGTVAWTWVVDDEVESGSARGDVVCSGGSRGQTKIRIV
jgi:hypothetical protein